MDCDWNMFNIRIMSRIMKTFSELTGLAFHLVQHHLLDEESMQLAIMESKQHGMSLIQYLVKNNLLSSDIILKTLSKLFGLSVILLTDDYLKNNTLLPLELIRRYRVIPIEKKEGVLHLAVSDPTNQTVLDAIQFHSGMQLKLILTGEKELNELLEQKDPLEMTLHDNADPPLIHFVNHLIEHAVQQQTSDIHIEPYEYFCRIRYRRDGILYETTEIPHELSLRLITRLKVMAKLDIAERRLPQDGRLKFTTTDKKVINIRLSTCPTLFGEKIVLRLLDVNQNFLEINDLGLTDEQKKSFLKALSLPQGLILVTGPTGSGKTMTLYSALHHLNSSEKNISTVEDPIEFQLKGINQVNIHPKIGLDFEMVLRTFLRQDPDIIMVGEIRDLTTAKIAIQAAQTGHLVLSTLHTNSATETIARLQSMGVPSYQLTHSLTLVIAQRLIRKLCNRCKKIEILDSKETQHIIYRAAGCEHCLQGYHGRTGIYEVLSISTQQSHSMMSLKQAGLKKVLQGMTSLIEINRVTYG